MRSSSPGAAVWRRPGVAGLAIGLAIVPLIMLLRDDTRIFVALGALCIYPLLDVPLILARRSWWRGATVSVVVWTFVFVTMVATATSGRRPSDDVSSVFIYPFLLYWIALLVSGAVRLAGRRRGRRQDFGPKRGALFIAGTYATLVIVPVTLGVVPPLMEKFTGNTPSSTIYSADGDVVSATPDHVTLRVGEGKTDSFRLGIDTRFTFRGPGSNTVPGTPGPEWLFEGRRVGLDYVLRGGERLASDVRIWIERKGCADDAKWTAALEASTPPTDATPSLVGTIWEGSIGVERWSDRLQLTTFEFLAENHLAYQDHLGARQTDARWRQNGAQVLVEVNDCYAEYEGHIEGDAITGEFSNQTGMRRPWSAWRKAGTVPVSTPK